MTEKDIVHLETQTIEVTELKHSFPAEQNIPL